MCYTAYTFKSLKMEDGLLSLKWNNHKSTFFDILRILREKANYTDATLAVEGKFYPVHKLVLSTCSEYFSEIFEQTPCKSPVIVLKDVRSQDLEALLDYMYLGEVNVNQNDLALLLKTAECLRVKGLAIPDEDPSKQTKDHLSSVGEEPSRETPPPKRRRHEDVGLTGSPWMSSSNGSEVSSNVAGAPVAGPSHLDSSADEPPAVVKVEMEDQDDGEDKFLAEGTFKGGSDSEGCAVAKADGDQSNFCTSSVFPAPSSNQAQTGDISWEENDGTFSQDNITESQSHQPAGDEEEEEVDVTSVGEDGAFQISNHSMALSVVQNREARRCQLCQVVLANSNLLRRHVEDHHFHIRKYDCVHCGKKFKRKEHRERHERIHTGEKPFACHICPARFTQKEHLKGHVENVHHKHGKDMPPGDQEGEKDLSTLPKSLSLPAASNFTSLIASAGNGLARILPKPSPLGMTTSNLASAGAISVPRVTRGEEKEHSVMALYAPVTRKTVNSPSKHVQTITINFS